MEPLIDCIYASVATCRFADRALARLLAVSRANNARLGVTGMLLHVDGSFFQVVDHGRAHKLLEAFARGRWRSALAGREHAA